jgi:hypothetical protein
VTRTSHTRFGKLLERRWLGSGLTAGESAKLKAHRDKCQDCRDEYGRQTAQYRAACNLPLDQLSGREENLLLEEVLVQAGVTSPKTVPSLFILHPSWTGGIAAAAAVLLIVLSGVFQSPVNLTALKHDALNTRGAPVHLPAAGLGLSGVDPGGQEYEILESGRVCLEDTLRFYVTVREEYRYYFIFALESDKALWYFPLPEEHSSYLLDSIPVFSHPVAHEIQLAHRHVEGPLTVVALFSHEPLKHRDVSHIVRHHLPQLPEGTPDIIVKELEQVLGPDVLAVSHQTRIIACGGTR